MDWGLVTPQLPDDDNNNQSKMILEEEDYLETFNQTKDGDMESEVMERKSTRARTDKSMSMMQSRR